MKTSNLFLGTVLFLTLIILLNNKPLDNSVFIIILIPGFYFLIKSIEQLIDGEQK